MHSHQSKATSDKFPLRYTLCTWRGMNRKVHYLFLAFENVCVEYYVIPNQPKKVVRREGRKKIHVKRNPSTFERSANEISKITNLSHRAENSNDDESLNYSTERIYLVYNTWIPHQPSRMIKSFHRKSISRWNALQSVDERFELLMLPLSFDIKYDSKNLTLIASEFRFHQQCNEIDLSEELGS